MDELGWVSFASGAMSCSGNWTIHNVMAIRQALTQQRDDFAVVTSLHFEQVERLDSAGAMLIVELQQQLKAVSGTYTTLGLTEEQSAIIAVVQEQMSVQDCTQQTLAEFTVLASLGRAVVERLISIQRFFIFMGEFVVLFGRCVMRPRQFYFSPLVSLFMDVVCRALPILGLMSFLIGVVLAYQLGVQLEMYGANIYIAKFSGVAVFREFGPLITAIIMAGRTSTSFASLIGSMKVNQYLAWSS